MLRNPGTAQVPSSSVVVGVRRRRRPRLFRPLVLREAMQTPSSNVLMEAACLTTELSAQGIANAAQSTSTPASEHEPATRAAGARGVEEISELSLQGLSNSAQMLGFV